MRDNKTKYQQTIDTLYDWLSESAHQDVLTLMDIVEKAKAYLRAAEELSAEEARTLENFLMRDFSTFSHQWQQDADQSLWLAGLKQRFWQLLANLSDQNRIEMFEMEMDMAHQGLYRAGELVSVGEIICNACGHRHQVDFVEQIQPCIECGGETFSRANLTH